MKDLPRQVFFCPQNLASAIAHMISICYRSFTALPEPAMTHHEANLKKAYAASGLSFLGISFVTACASPLLRIGLEGWVRAQSKKEKSAPVQPALI